MSHGKFFGPSFSIVFVTGPAAVAEGDKDDEEDAMVVEEEEG